MDPAGNADPRHGIREFIIGTGGESLDTVLPATPNLQAWADQYYGDDEAHAPSRWLQLGLRVGDGEPGRPGRNAPRPTATAAVAAATLRQTAASDPRLAPQGGRTPRASLPPAGRPIRLVAAAGRRWAARRVESCSARARSSVGERSLHTREVAGSSPAVPMMKAPQIGGFLFYPTFGTPYF